MLVRRPAALAEALATTPAGTPPTIHGSRGQGRSAGAAATTSPGRLTLTAEEAAALLGISRAFAYEAVRRGEIPSIPHRPTCASPPRGTRLSRQRPETAPEPEEG
ncbi:MAG: helix-turn-helix domain-containing protein [Acidimicrobiales bacterium]